MPTTRLTGADTKVEKPTPKFTTPSSDIVVRFSQILPHGQFRVPFRGEPMQNDSTERSPLTDLPIAQSFSSAPELP
jgi:hypothetical protein